MSDSGEREDHTSTPLGPRLGAEDEGRATFEDLIAGWRGPITRSRRKSLALGEGPLDGSDGEDEGLVSRQAPTLQSTTLSLDGGGPPGLPSRRRREPLGDQIRRQPTLAWTEEEKKLYLLSQPPWVGEALAATLPPLSQTVGGESAISRDPWRVSRQDREGSPSRGPPQAAQPPPDRSGENRPPGLARAREFSAPPMMKKEMKMGGPEAFLQALKTDPVMPTLYRKALQGEKPLEDVTNTPTAPVHSVGAQKKPIVLPGKFDGTTDLAEYLSHFDLCIQANGWGTAQSGMFLGLSLTGVARRLLTDAEPTTEAGYWGLRSALERRFQPANQVEMYKTLLRNRSRRSEETLQCYAEDLRRLTRLSYPVADAGTTDSMTRDKFVEGLGDKKLRHWIFQSKPKSLDDAVANALEAEAFLSSEKDLAGETVRAAGTTMGEQLQALTEQVAALKQQPAAPYNPQNRGYQGPPRLCYKCGDKGHLKRVCPIQLAEDRAAAVAAAGQISGN
jgi:hypothetical protein